MLLSLDCFQTTCIQLGLSNHTIDQGLLYGSLYTQLGIYRGFGTCYSHVKLYPFPALLQDVCGVMLCCDSCLLCNC